MNELFFPKNENKLMSEYNQPEKGEDADENHTNKGEKSQEKVQKNGNDHEEKSYKFPILFSESEKQQLKERTNLGEQSGKVFPCVESKKADSQSLSDQKESIRYSSMNHRDQNANVQHRSSNESNSGHVLLVETRESNIQHSDALMIATNEQKRDSMLSLSNNDNKHMEELNAKSDFLIKQQPTFDENVNNPGSFNHFPDEANTNNNNQKLGKPCKKKKNPSDRGEINANKETPKKKKHKNYTNYIKENNSHAQDDMRYINNYEFMNDKCYVEQPKRNTSKKSDNINIDIFYSSKSENSLDESEEGSSVDSVEELYENICQSDAPLDFYKNSLTAKNEANQAEPEYDLNTKNNATEEISILNSYIKNITENSQNSSSSVDVDNKLVNILSLSFLTFIDHVIYDSHIYALKNEVSKGGQVEKNNNPIGDHNSNSDIKSKEELSSVTTQNDEHIKNDVIPTNVENNNVNEKTLSNNKMDVPTENGVEFCNRSTEEKYKEGCHSANEINNSNETEGKANSTQLVFNPDVINLCLTNLYNQELVNRIVDKKKRNNNVNAKNGINTCEVKSKENNEYQNHSKSVITNGNMMSNTKEMHTFSCQDNNVVRGKEEILKADANYLKEDTEEIIGKGTSHNKMEYSIQTNISNKLSQRKIIIDQINEKIKNKSDKNVHNFSNTMKYSLDDIFEL
ncbi:hypothetical protein POVWA2_061480 [Plasmodium ovale wallikeri]|uniref:Uncharacterized protein n=1 Tax=Plasmodium ovale wallikeri TaxID=864142 RepID=A0A1A9A4N8_PLAOA|nr:hypothetical protein POVWA1_061920 [Plasmodium ovale wallikeri]SBT51063.1 hypothetical protein POVWA2_061480 [Plasmodium ovale wallikeri]